MQRYTFKDFEKDFPTDDACLEWLKNYLYPDGIFCKKCDAGEISQHFRLVQPIVINFEPEQGGKTIASDDIFFMYGEGATRLDALRDYVTSLSEYYALLESRRDTPSVNLFLYLQSYLQPILK